MINLLLGRPGSGKSYEAVVFHILDALKSGRKVITNLPLDLDFLFAVFPDSHDLLEIRFKSVSPYSSLPFTHISDFNDSWRGADNIGALYVIDECHKFFPAGGTHRSINEWFAEHRHLGVDVLLITQSSRKVSRDICDMVQVVYKLSNNRSLGTDKSYVRKVYDGVRGSLLSTQIRSYDPANFKFYKSHTKLSASVKESQAKDIKPLWHHWSFIGAGLFLFLGVPYLVYNLAFHNPIDVNSYTKSNKVVNAPVVASEPVSIAPSNHIASPAVSSQDSKAVDFGAFSSLQLHISGFIAYDSGPKKGLFMYSFYASQNGQVVASLSQDDLTAAGYSVQRQSSCSAKVTYKTVTRFVLCDLPTNDLNPRSNFNFTGNGEGSRFAGGAPIASN